MQLPIDDVLAFATWFAYHGIPMRDNGDHPLLREMPWHAANCSVLDDAADCLLNPESHDAEALRHPWEARELFSKLPANAHRYALRLLLFEIALAPASASAERLLEIVRDSLQTSGEVLPIMLSNPGQLGQFLYGPFGVVVRKCKARRICRLEEGYCKVINALPDLFGWSSSSFSSDYSIHAPEGWSDAQLSLWNQQKLLDPDGLARGQLFFSLHSRRNWVTGVLPERANEDRQVELLGHIDDSAVLTGVLRACLKADRKRFFADTETWDYAPQAKKALGFIGKAELTLHVTDLAPSRELLAVNELRHLTLIASPESMFRAVNALGCVPTQTADSFFEDIIEGGRVVPPWAAGQAFAINLARAMQEAYERLGRTDELDRMTPAQGERLQRVLHYVLRLGPENVLLSRLHDPTIASALAAITYCSPEFGEPGTWDITDTDLQAQLLREIKAGLCFKGPPRVQQKANPCDRREAGRLFRQRDQQAVKRYGNQARTNAEWVLKTAIQWAFSVWSVLGSPMDSRCQLRGNNVPSVEPFFNADNFRALVDAQQLAANDGKLLLSSLTLEPLNHLLSSLDNVLPIDGRPQMKPMFEALKELRRLYVDYEVAKNGNTCSHDQIPEPSIEKLRTAIEALIDFDEEARILHDAFPRFLTLVEIVMRPNEPYRATFIPLVKNDGDVDEGSASVEFYFTNNWVLKGGRVYAALNVSRNTLSVDPIIVDWTDWVKQGT